MPFNTIPELLDDIRAGRMVVILDSEDRENEGDLIMAAQKVRPKDVNFMLREARGLLCLALSEERTQQLGLRPMVGNNTSRYHTNFTVSIEAASGVSTGISAYDRAHTILTAVQADARPKDLSQPGHVFPLTMRPGGVLARPGHTEAGSDLSRLAGLEPAAVLIEILHENGSMARRPDLEIFARKHGLKMGSIAELIRYRLQNECVIVQVHEETLSTEFGPFRLLIWRDTIRNGLHCALVHGVVDDTAPVLTYIHRSCIFSELFHLKQSIKEPFFTSVLGHMAAEESSVLLLLSGEETTDSLLARFKAVRDAQATPARLWCQYQYGLCAQMLNKLGVRTLRMLGGSDMAMGLGALGLEVIKSA